MEVFDNKWIYLVYCLLWELREVDEWDFHRLVYELNEKGLIPINSWTWFGSFPRSAEIDALIALLEMYGVVRRDGETLIVVKPPGSKCVFNDEVLSVVEKIRGERKTT